MKVKKKKTKSKKAEPRKSAVPSFSSMPGYLSYWMSFLPKHMLLRDLIIPGTHAANTYDLNEPKLLKSFVKCQKLGIMQQLEMGIRYLDFRFGIKTKKKFKKLGIDR